MNATGIIKRARPGDEVSVYCGRCKEERRHQVVALGTGGGIEQVICGTCHGSHRYRERSAVLPAVPTSQVSKMPKPSGTAHPLGGRVSPTGLPSGRYVERAYSSSEVYAAGQYIAHARFGTGRVIMARAGKVDVQFGGEIRTLIHAG